ncbi:hypothetical protein [Polaribacter sp. Asnod1-A03]|uniref:hypothetical protein n=1 Tax=Polaribacter sp. Asnod1-A03 TaxID=3160581 RepID=UPI003868A8BC
MRNKLLFLVFFIFSYCIFSQQIVTWQDLAKVTFTDKYFVAYDDTFMYPTFLAPVKALEGKTITVKGYFLNIAPEQKIYILSKGPMSSCFFCGQGGPETAIELHFIEKPNFKTDDIIAVTGVLKLNQDDVEHFNYILTDCKAILVE